MFLFRLSANPSLAACDATRLQRQLCGKQGFALILALGLLSFITLLLVSLTAMVRVEVSASWVAKDRALARQNALLGLRQAMGALQRHAGPDQRVTAKASLLPGAHPSRVNMVGVWNSEAGGPDEGERLAWLVSDRTPDHRNPVPTESPFLVEAIPETASGAGDGAAAVRARPVPIRDADGATTGRIAWWVDDEGAKASVGAGPADRLPEQTGVSAEPARLAAAWRTAPELLPGLTSLNNPQRWASAGSRAELSILWSSASYADSIERNFHHLTARSLGLLTNVRDGGFKRDLTAGLQPGSDLIENDTGSDWMFPPQWSAGTDQDPGGPLWEQLRDFYNTRVAGSGSGTISFQEGTDEQLSIAPVVTWGVVGAHALRADAAGNSVRMFLMPAFRFWNPYQHRLEMPSFVVSTYLGRPRWRVRDQDGQEVNANFNLLYYQWRIPATTWEPGECITFTPNTHQPYGPSGSIPTLARGWRAGYGSYRDFPAGSPLAPGNLILETRHSRASQLFLSLSPANPTEEYFLVMARLFNFAGGREVREIGGSAGAVPPPPSEPLRMGVHGNEIPAVNFNFAMKFAEASTDQMSWIDFPEENVFLGHYNPRGAFAGGTTSEFLYNISSYTTMPLYTSYYNRSDTSYADTGSAAVGYSATLPGPFEAAYFSFLHEEEPVVSIGQLAGAHLARDPDYQPDFSRAANDDGVFDDTQPSFAIGNSLADPRVPNDRVFRNWNGIYTGTSKVTGRGTEYDHSYLLNEALWDRFFFSDIPRNDPLDNFDRANPRLDLLGSPSEADLLDYEQAARNLAIDGAFNFHSGSVEAWKVVLGAFWNEQVATIEDGIINGSELSSMTRSFRPLQAPYDPATHDGLSAATHNGFRQLTESELQSLAAQIVAGLRERVAEQGRPFLSKAEFVNRSLDSAVEAHRLRGVLQQAIDETNINANLSGGRMTLDMTEAEKQEMRAKNGTNVTGMQPENAEGDLLFGVPGYLMQADLLAKLGHFLTPRSDTFLIRAYGDSEEPATGNTTSEARCEAIVQRVPEEIGNQFGRRFVIREFEWLE